MNRDIVWTWDGYEINEVGDTSFFLNGDIVNAHLESAYYVAGVPNDPYSVTFSESIAAFGFMFQAGSPTGVLTSIWPGWTSWDLNLNSSTFWGATIFIGVIAESESEVFSVMNSYYAIADNSYHTTRK